MDASTGFAKVTRDLTERRAPDGGRVALQVDAADGFATVSVSDNGQGIAPDDLEAIFEFFT